MLQKTYTFGETFYSYFARNGGRKDYYSFTSLAECLKARRDSLSKNFDYGDAYLTTGRIFVRFAYVPDHQRPHVRSKYEWERMQEEEKERRFAEEHGGFTRDIVEFLTALVNGNTEDNDDVLV